MNETVVGMWWLCSGWHWGWWWGWYGWWFIIWLELE